MPHKIFFLPLILSLFIWTGCSAPESPAENHFKEKSADTHATSEATPLIFTKHALCRMACREITEAEVRAVIANGKTNARKSEPEAKPCPKIALEAWTEDGQEVRLILAKCREGDKVVTVIDLNHDHECHCP